MSELTLFRAAEAPDILLNPRDDAGELAVGRLTRPQVVDMLGCRKDELDELIGANLLTLREDNDGRLYLAGREVKRLLKNLEAVDFAEIESSDDQDGDYADEEAVPAQKAKPAPAVPTAEDEAAEDDTEAEADQVNISGPAAAVAAFFKNLFGGEQVISEVEATAEEAEPVKRSNPLFGLGKSRKSRRSGR